MSAGTSSAILSLPDEVLTSIILHLTSREAIYLSISSRRFFHGVLSRYNSFLWYRLMCGPYPWTDATLPGLCTQWAFPQNSMLPMAPSGPRGTLAAVPWRSPLREPPPLLVPTVDVRHLTPLPQGPWQPTVEEPRARLGNAVGMKSKDFKDCVINFRTMEPHRRFEGGAIQYIPDYRRLLGNSMLGDTEDGCQWCLKWDRRKSSCMVPELNMRLCQWCLASNLIAQRGLENIPIDTSHLICVSSYNNIPIQEVNEDHLPLDLPFLGYWRPAVQKIVRQTLGDGVLLDKLLKWPYREPYVFAGVPGAKKKWFLWFGSVLYDR